MSDGALKEWTLAQMIFPLPSFTATTTTRPRRRQLALQAGTKGVGGARRETMVAMDSIEVGECFHL
jgi:hypothetical protein